MKKWRERSIGRCVKEGTYFKALGGMIDLAQREISNPAHRKRGEKILTNLRGDMDYLQENYRILKSKTRSTI